MLSDRVVQHRQPSLRSRSSPPTRPAVSSLLDLSVESPSRSSPLIAKERWSAYRALTSPHSASRSSTLICLSTFLCPRTRPKIAVQDPPPLRHTIMPRIRRALRSLPEVRGPVQFIAGRLAYESRV